MKKFKFKIEGADYEVVVTDVDHNTANVEINGKTFAVEVEKEEAVKPHVERVVAHSESKSAPAKAAAPRPTASGSGKAVKAQLPGSITKIVVSEGQAVKRGDLLLTMESMKMENKILSSCDGTVKAILVQAGQNVLQGDALVEIA